jgi:IMP dehydrogenase
MSNIKLIQSYCFDDVLMLPRNSDIKSRKEISLTTNIASENRNLSLNIPLISSPMDTVSGEKMAIKMALEGGLGIIHRFMSFDEQLQSVENVKRYINYVFTKPYTIKTNENYKELNEKYGIKTFIVVNNKNEFKGLVTNRDYQNTNNNEIINYTSYYSLHKIFYTKDQFENIINNRNSEYFHNFMIYCRNLMMKYKVEKCPIFEKIIHLDVYVKYGENYENTNNLLGLVTMKSVEHYFHNRTKACLDTDGRLCVGAAVGIRDDYLERVEALVKGGVDCICVDVANGHNIYTINAVKEIRKRYPDLVIMSGNVCSAEGFLNLANAGSDCIRVGIGNGSICSTRLETGIGYGQWSVIADCYKIKKDNNLSTKIICDGGSLGKTGNKVKALAIGADAVILGRTLAGTIESPGTVITRNGKRVKYFRGMASTMANISGQESCSKRAKLDTNFTAEGVDGVVEIKGSASDTLNQICGGIRSGLSYLGVCNFIQLDELRINNEIQWVQSTPIGLLESGTRIKTF